MLKATCPECKEKTIPFTLGTDQGELAVESGDCERCGNGLSEEKTKEKVKILVQAIMRKTGAPKAEAFARALALMAS